jgi:hypothetical protein
VGRIMTDVTERRRKQRAETRRIATEREVVKSLPKCSKCLAVGLPKDFRCQLSGCPQILFDRSHSITAQVAPKSSRL